MSKTQNQNQEFRARVRDAVEALAVGAVLKEELPGGWTLCVRKIRPRAVTWYRIWMDDTSGRFHVGHSAYSVDRVLVRVGELRRRLHGANSRC